MFIPSRVRLSVHATLIPPISGPSRFFTLGAERTRSVHGRRRSVPPARQPEGEEALSSSKAWRVRSPAMVVFSLIAAGCGDEDSDRRGRWQPAGRRGRRGQHLGAPARHRLVRPVGSRRPPVLHRGVRGGRPVGRRGLQHRQRRGRRLDAAVAGRAGHRGRRQRDRPAGLDTGSGATIIDQARESDVQVVEYDRFNTGGSGGDAYVELEQRLSRRGDGRGDDEPAIDALGLARRGGVMLNGGEEDNNSSSSCSSRATRRRSVPRVVTPATGSWSRTTSSPSGTTPRPRR